MVPSPWKIKQQASCPSTAALGWRDPDGYPQALRSLPPCSVRQTHGSGCGPKPWNEYSKVIHIYFMIVFRNYWSFRRAPSPCLQDCLWTCCSPNGGCQGPQRGVSLAGSRANPCSRRSSLQVRKPAFFGSKGQQRTVFSSQLIHQAGTFRCIPTTIAYYFVLLESDDVGTLPNHYSLYYVLLESDDVGTLPNHYNSVLLESDDVGTLPNHYNYVLLESDDVGTLPRPPNHYYSLYYFIGIWWCRNTTYWTLVNTLRQDFAKRVSPEDSAKSKDHGLSKYSLRSGTQITEIWKL